MGLDVLTEIIGNQLNSIIKNNTIMLIIVSIALGINILGFIINIILQCYLKNKELVNEIAFKKADNKIKNYEDIYNEMIKLPNIAIDGQLSIINSNLIETIKNLRLNSKKSGLYINKETKILLKNYCDYFSIVATDKTQRDNNKEEEFIRKFEDLFKKI